MTDDARVLDLTGTLPRLREKKLARAFEETVPGDGFVVVNDYDPKVFIESFLATVHTPSGWTYLEREGVWRVRVERRAATP